jgi:DNA-binding IclR family transcriptional regulator
MARPSPQTDRVVAVARLLAAHPDEGFTISELARRLRLNKATCYPMVAALADAGWLVRDPTTKAYRLGPELITIGEAAGRSLPAVQLARPAMVELATELGVTCAAFTCDGDVATLADQVWDVRSTVQPLRVGLWAPVRAPFGAVFASWSSDSALEPWLSDIDERVVPRYRAAVAAIRARGYVVELRTPSRDSGPSAPGTGSLAELMPSEVYEGSFLLADLDPKTSYPVSTIEAPVFDGAGNIALGLVLVGVPRVMSTPDIELYAKRLLQATTALTASLAGTRD